MKTEEYRSSHRVVGPECFADVPSGCEWVGDASTNVSVTRVPPSLPDGTERLQMSGCVIVRGGDRVVLSCGGLIVSVPKSRVESDVNRDATVIFTRGVA